jgi:hypothetical protein
MDHLQKLATPQNLLILVVLLVAGYFIYDKYYKSESMASYKKKHYENMATFKMPHRRENLENVESGDNTLAAPTVSLAATPEASLTGSPNELLPSDLLPNYDEATKIKGNAVTDTLKSQNFIIGSFPQGLDTVSTSKRIPYYDIRNNYPVPKEEYPWNNSPYDEAPGGGRRFFDIGA